MARRIWKNLLFILLGIGIGISLIIVVIIFILTTLTSSFKTPDYLHKHSWLILNYPDSLQEKPTSSNSSLFSFSKNLELIKFVNSIEMAAIDKRIDGILINGDLTFYKREHVEEIRKAIDNFKLSGKKVYAWFSSANNKNYALSISADEIYMPDTDSASLSLRGFAMSIPYFKDAINKIGLNVNVIHIGSYKGAGENLTRNSISKELKESYLWLLNSLFENNINEIIKRRDISKSKLKELMENGKTIELTPKEALNYKLIDGLKSYQELLDSIKTTEDFKYISIADYSKRLENNKKRNKIAIIYAEGSISNYYTGSSKFEGEIIGAKSMIADIEKIKKDDTIKAVILRVNSPGGSALASELILQELLKLKEVKPLYVSMGPMAASGGYYISLAAKKIFASPSTITGSIGVVSMFVSHKPLTDNLGIYYSTLKKYKYDDFLSPTRLPKDDEIAILRKSMEKIYKEFTEHVIKERNIDRRKISQIAEGRVWTGRQALEKGLIDKIGSLNDTLSYVAKTEKLESYSIVSYPKPPSFFEMLANSSDVKLTSDIIVNSKIKKIIQLYNFIQKNGYSPCYYLPLFEIE